MKHTIDFTTIINIVIVLAIACCIAFVVNAAVEESNAINMPLHNNEICLEQELILVNDSEYKYSNEYDEYGWSMYVIKPIIVELPICTPVCGIQDAFVCLETSMAIDLLM